jgi:hypothetical protein
VLDRARAWGLVVDAAITLTGDIPDLRVYGWNDMASSIQIR